MKSAVAVPASGKRFEIRFDDSPLARGGEGAVHLTRRGGSASSDLLYKRYTTPQAAVIRRPKIEYLVQQAPLQSVPVASAVAPTRLVAWPEATVSEGGIFLGYLMPYVRDAIQLQELSSSSNRIVERHGPAWARFSPNALQGFALRAKIARNLASCVAHVHGTQRYVLVDLKPANVLVMQNGLVTLVDIDSIQVMEGERLLFRGPVATPAYTPPEGQAGGSLSRADAKPASWDIFSLGVIVYELLFGIHPSAGTCIDPTTHAPLSLPEEKIARRLFAVGSKASSFQVTPPPHSAFATLPADVQELFIRTFEADGRRGGQRPTAADWYVVLNRWIERGAIVSPNVGGARRRASPAHSASGAGVVSLVAGGSLKPASVVPVTASAPGGRPTISASPAGTPSAAWSNVTRLARRTVRLPKVVPLALMLVAFVVATRAASNASQQDQRKSMWSDTAAGRLLSDTVSIAAQRSDSVPSDSDISRDTDTTRVQRPGLVADSLAAQQPVDRSLIPEDVTIPDQVPDSTRLPQKNPHDLTLGDLARPSSVSTTLSSPPPLASECDAERVCLYDTEDVLHPLMRLTRADTVVEFHATGTTIRVKLRNGVEGFVLAPALAALPKNVK